jgi:hypothetical protein
LSLYAEFTAAVDRLHPEKAAPAATAIASRRVGMTFDVLIVLQFQNRERS